MAIWNERTIRGTVAELHGSTEEVNSKSREIIWRDPTDTAMVLGSAQDESVLDADAVCTRNISIVRRSSGGGAVLVKPSNMIWFDIMLPRDDVHWTDDVNVSFLWIGHAIARALKTCRVQGITTQGAINQRNQWTSLVCYAGIGPGESSVWGKKVIGISQKRKRMVAHYHCNVIREFDATEFVSLLRLEGNLRRELTTSLQRNVGELPKLDVDLFRSALRAALNEV